MFGHTWRYWRWCFTTRAGWRHLAWKVKNRRMQARYFRKMAAEAREFQRNYRPRKPFVPPPGYDEAVEEFRKDFGIKPYRPRG